MNAEELAKRNMIVKMLAGSHAYGTAIATSDTDYRGLFTADPINILTPFFPIKESVDSKEEDTKYYELWQFMKLCLECNPNIIELLWTDDADIIFRTPAYDELRKHRQRLLCSKVAFTTSGYAIAQLKRIKGHNKWINNPQRVEAPKPMEFVALVQWFGRDKMMPRDFKIENFCNDYRLIPYSETLLGLYTCPLYATYDKDGGLITNYEGSREELDTPLAILKWNRDEYRTAKERHEQYWDWKKNRNEKRSELEERFGYDTKHAMHLVRLLRMGVEALRDGEIVVKRPDAKELLEIRGGAWQYEELVKYAEAMDTEVRDVWYHKTQLPKKPDIQFGAQLLMDIQEMVWHKK